MRSIPRTTSHMWRARQGPVFPVDASERHGGSVVSSDRTRRPGAKGVSAVVFARSSKPTDDTSTQHLFIARGSSNLGGVVDLALSCGAEPFPERGVRKFVSRRPPRLRWTRWFRRSGRHSTTHPDIGTLGAGCAGDPRRMKSTVALRQFSVAPCFACLILDRQPIAVTDDGSWAPERLLNPTSLARRASHHSRLGWHCCPHRARQSIDSSRLGSRSRERGSRRPFS